jgi:hypothetical protein
MVKKAAVTSRAVAARNRVGNMRESLLYNACARY